MESIIPAEGHGVSASSSKISLLANIEAKGPLMKSSHQLCLEVIEESLQHAAGFQLHAAKRKVLVIRDSLADDQAYCDALLLKIDHALKEAFVAPTTRATLPALSGQDLNLAA
jgi:hypothetical protein